MLRKLKEIIRREQTTGPLVHVINTHLLLPIAPVTITMTSIIYLSFPLPLYDHGQQSAQCSEHELTASHSLGEEQPWSQRAVDFNLGSTTLQLWNLG